jgi:presenilin-like A22 family membrane protease
MKYDFKTIFVLISLFFISQVVGLGILYKDMKVEVVNGTQQVFHPETVLGPRPEVSGWESFVWIITAIATSTIILLVIIKIGIVNIWKLLFFGSIFLAITLSLGVLINPVLAFIIAFILALIKIFKPNVIIHNITEVLMYSGIAVMLVPLFELKWVIALLLAISLYDFYAVFKSKHMVTMAKFQIKSKVFAGIMIPYKAVKKGKQKKIVGAIIGGGDVAFPLMFSGVVMESLVKFSQLTKGMAFVKTLIIPIFICLTLLFLLFKGKEGKFYPAMPFITASCLIAYAVIWLI